MIKLKVRAAVAAVALVCATASAVAETKVIGEVVASPSAVLNAGSASQRVDTRLVPYLQGDKLTTSNDASAAISLTSGKASFAAAPSTVMQIVDGDKGEVAVDQGAVKFSAVQGFPISFTTISGTIKVSSDVAMEAVVVV